MNTRQLGYASLELLAPMIITIGCMGWVMNFIKVAYDLSEPVTLLLIFQVAGVLFFPLGMVFGWVIW